VPGLELVPLARADECCGFGGVFAVQEEAVSCRMALDRLADHAAARAEVVTSTDVSCLLHLEGVARRRGLPLRMLHVAEILAGAAQPGAEA
jgi:L-lactate dehydrogenase complex protein LldE